MNWYSKYLSVFEKPFESVPESVIREIQENLKRLECKTPIASVVVIAHNEEDRVLSCLWSLSNNICQYPVEIIGVDNHSTDRTQQVFKSLGIKWFYEEKRGPGHARTCGLLQAQGKYHLCIDADTIYPPYYMQTMIDELTKPEISGVTSLWSFIPDQSHSRVNLKLYEFIRDVHLRLLFFKRPELCVRGMVFGFKTELGRKIGFRTNIIRGEDGAMALGLKRFGKIKFVTNRKARAVTSNTTLNSDGSLLRSFMVRFRKAVKGINKYYTIRTEYKDQENNLIK